MMRRHRTAIAALKEKILNLEREIKTLKKQMPFATQPQETHDNTRGKATG